MNAHLDKNELSFCLGSLSYIGPDYDEPPVINTSPPGRSFKVWITALGAEFLAWRHRCAVIEEMSMMTDRELADIGLSRSDLPRVFDAKFTDARGPGFLSY